MSDITPESNPNLFKPEILKKIERYENNLVSIFDKCLKVLLPRERVHLSEWMDTYYTKPAEEGVGDPWITKNIQKGILTAICHENTTNVYFSKFAQFGGSTMAVAAQNYFNIEYDYNTCYYLPSDPEAKEHSKLKWATMIRDIPKLNDALLAKDVEAKHPKNVHDFKLFTTSAAYCRGAISTSRFQRITLHFIVLDEIDRMDRNVGGAKKGEGSPLKLAEGRFQEKGYGKIFVLGTPTQYGDSPIYEVCQKCEDLYEWHAPCPLCSEKQVITWGGPNSKYGFKWDNSLATDKQKVASSHYVCKHCQGSFGDIEFKKVMDQGVWVNKYNQDWIDIKDKVFRNKDNEILEVAPREIAFVASPDCSGLLSNKPWNDALMSFLGAVKNAKGGKSQDLVTWFNTYAGVPFREESQKEADPEDLIIRREDYFGTIPNGVERLTMGVDFQDKFCKYQIDGHGFDGEQWALICERVEGRTDDIESEMWDELHAIANDTYYRQDGKHLKIDVVIADARHNGQNVFKWCGRHRNQRFAVAGDGKDLNRDLFDVDWKKDFIADYNCWYVTINSNQASTLLYAKLSTARAEKGNVHPNYYHFPLSDKFGPDYFSELTADKESWDAAPGGGQWVKRYKKANRNIPNEAHDIAKYQFIALQVLEMTNRNVYSAKNVDYYDKLSQDAKPTSNSETDATQKEEELTTLQQYDYLKRLYGLTDIELQRQIKQLESSGIV